MTAALPILLKWCSDNGTIWCWRKNIKGNRILEKAFKEYSHQKSNENKIYLHISAQGEKNTTNVRFKQQFHLVKFSYLLLFGRRGVWGGWGIPFICNIFTGLCPPAGVHSSDEPAAGGAVSVEHPVLRQEQGGSHAGPAVDQCGQHQGKVGIIERLHIMIIPCGQHQGKVCITEHLHMIIQCGQHQGKVCITEHLRIIIQCGQIKVKLASLSISASCLSSVDNIKVKSASLSISASLSSVDNIKVKSASLSISIQCGQHQGKVGITEQLLIVMIQCGQHQGKNLHHRAFWSPFLIMPSKRLCLENDEVWAFLCVWYVYFII